MTAFEISLLDLGRFAQAGNLSLDLMAILLQKARSHTTVCLIPWLLENDAVDLLKDIQSDILNPSIQLSTILRKAKVLAVRIKMAQFRTWVESELSGYDSIDGLPEYRVIPTQSFGHFVGPLGAQLRNAPIHTRGLPDEMNRFANTLELVPSVRELESLLESDEGTFQMMWPANLTALIAGRVYEHNQCLQAWRAVSRSKIEGILETIRNRLLSFVLEIEALGPTADMAPGARELTPEVLSQVFNTYIMGNQNIVATGDSIHQTVSLTITKHDMESLVRHVTSLGIGDREIQDLRIALESDGHRTARDGFGDRVAAWIGSMVEKAAKGVWRVSLHVAPSVLVNAISNFYGWRADS